MVQAYRPLTVHKPSLNLTTTTTSQPPASAKKKGYVENGQARLAQEIASYYARASKAVVAELIETLVAVGNVRQLEDGHFAVYK